MNHKQILAITIAVLGVLMVSTTQLTDIFGPGPTKILVSVAGMLNSILASVMAVITSQTGLLKDVQAMPGVDKITVNANSNSTLAAMAVDPINEKIEPVPGAEGIVASNAKNG